MMARPKPKKRPAKRPALRKPRSLADYFDLSGETQGALARRTGISQPAISNAKAGRGVSLAMAKRLSRATGVPLDAFGPDV